MFPCPHCGKDVTLDEIHANEDVCADCCEQAQAELDLHWAEFDRWRRMTSREREDAIRVNL
jgi:endogenous inhibitor of DNA gyrase (YacG/DUF329 family)